VRSEEGGWHGDQFLQYSDRDVGWIAVPNKILSAYAPLCGNMPILKETN
jgi:hypothetical protein